MIKSTSKIIILAVVSVLSFGLSMFALGLWQSGSDETVAAVQAASPVDPSGLDQSNIESLMDLPDIEELRTLFNQDEGKPRLILVFSPTCPTCRASAQWVQQNILEKNPSVDLEVYVVWEPILPSDARSEWDARLMSDPRITHFWDEETVSGQWFDQQGFLESYNLGVIWDSYMLFGPDATWDMVPSPLISEGYPVIFSSQQLETDILPLLND